jgi:hypothetical protein
MKIDTIARTSEFGDNSVDLVLLSPFASLSFAPQCLQ